MVFDETKVVFYATQPAFDAMESAFYITQINNVMTDANNYTVFNKINNEGRKYLSCIINYRVKMTPLSLPLSNDQ